MRYATFLRPAWLAVTASLACVPAAGQVRDVDLKAAYIYNFAQFTTWPDLGRTREPFTVCASATSLLWRSLLAYNGKQVNNRGWQAADTSQARPGGCDVLVLAHAAERPPATPGMLVVRDGMGNGADPVAITLVDGDEQIRFDVDTEAAMRNGLRFSSKLLRLARNVK